MIILCTSNDLQKKKKVSKKLSKILISDVLEASKSDKNVYQLDELLPTVKVMNAFLDGDKPKNVRKKYINNILCDTNKLAMVVCIAVLTLKEQNCIICTSKQEYEYGFIQSLAKILNKRYGFNVTDKLSKKVLSDNKIDGKTLLEDYNQVYELIINNKNDYKKTIKLIEKHSDKNLKKKYKKHKKCREEEISAIDEILSSKDNSFNEQSEFVIEPKVIHKTKVYMRIK